MNKMTPWPRWLFGFQASRIQQWILLSGRLRDIQGASQLLEELCRVVFPNVLESARSNHEMLGQAAGWARVLIADEGAARALYAAWPLIVDQLAPGLPVQQALIEVRDAQGLAAAHVELSTRLRAARNAPTVSLPHATPPMMRNPRTGLAAVAVDRTPKRVETIDREIAARRAVFRELQTQKHRQGRSRLDERCLGDSALEFESGRDDGEGRLGRGYVGVVHADGNSIGRVLRELLRESGDASQFPRFSRALAEATEGAVKDAVAEVLAPCADGPVVPARPILVGGDDVTILVAGELAVPFAACYLSAFESRAKDLVGRLGQVLTACCGVALVKANFPYDRAHELAESLCQQAKRRARAAANGGRIPGAIAFYRVTTSLPGDADVVLERELTAVDGTRLTMEAYGVGEVAKSTGLPMLTSLQGTIDAIAALGRTGLRELATAIQVDSTRADIAWDRIREVAGARRRTQRALEDMERSLEEMGIPRGSFRTTDAPRRTPLLDALRLARPGAGEREMEQTEATS